MGDTSYTVLDEVTLFKFVAIQTDGDCYDPEAQKGGLDHLLMLGRENWRVVGVLPGSAYEGFGHTLIMQKIEHDVTIYHKD